MTVWPCASQPVDCPNFDGNPLINNSSELPDPFTFFADAYGPNIPPYLGWKWSNPVGYAPCYSPISEAAAEACATGIVNTIPGTWVPPDRQPNPPGRTFKNQPVSASASCPDGSIYVFEVAAGMFSASSVAAANEAALDWGMQQAELHLLCLSALPSIVCVGQEIDLAITPSSAFVAPPGSNIWDIEGDPPDGTTFVPASSGPASIIGTPLTPGVFSFEVFITLPNDDHTSRVYALTVAGITNATLPDATIGTPYSAALETVGFAAPLFSLESGSLPPGLTLNQAGTISGTPTGTPAGYSFVVNVKDGLTGFQCDQTVSLTTTTPGCSPMPTPRYTVTMGVDCLNSLCYRSNPPVGNFPLMFVADFSTQKLWNINLLNHATTNVNSAFQVQNATYAAAVDFVVAIDNNTFNVVRLNPQTLATISSNSYGPSFLLSGIVYNPKNHLCYISEQAEFIDVYDPSVDILVAQWDSGTANIAPQGLLSFDTANNLMYCALFNNGSTTATLAKFDVSTSLPVLIATYPMPVDDGLGANLQQAIFCPDNKLVYCVYADVLNSSKYRLTRFNTVTNTFKNTVIIGTPNVSCYPAYNPTSKLLFFPRNANSIDVYCALTDMLVCVQPLPPPPIPPVCIYATNQPVCALAYNGLDGTMGIMRNTTPGSSDFEDAG